MLIAVKPGKRFGRSSKPTLAERASALWPDDTPAEQWDAVALMRQAGMEPDPWQVRVATTPGDHLLLCHRQAGKSTIVAAIALADALAQDEALILLVSRSMRQSTELLRKVKQFFHIVQPMALLRDAELGIELANHSRILSLPASEETIVGFSAVTRLILDEAARIPDATYYSVRPMLAMSQGSMLALSSPFGRRGFFYEAWAGTQTDEAALDLATVERLLADLHFPIDELSDHGVTGAGPVDTRQYEWTKTYLPATHNPRLSKRFLANERRNIPDLWWRQEWMVEFVELGQVVFRYEDLMSMLSGDVAPLYGADGEVQAEGLVLYDEVQPLALNGA
jgi:hypothetical protein